MREMKRVLKEWNRDSFGNIDAQYQEIVGEIEVLDARLNSDELGSNDLQHKRDKNTQFFHRQARIKLVRNGILGL
ncbi:hypothetical protein V6N12_046087 [Hibiscus sabdariffa]|uniref:Uncharacterized protein n=1 Tax=Hibiscus sabdariffa TaxID=183260 RepID=A0ABR2G4J4_9ROSI